MNEARRAALLLVALGACAPRRAEPEARAPESCFACDELAAQELRRADDAAPLASGLPEPASRTLALSRFETVQLGPASPRDEDGGLARPRRTRKVDLDLVRAPFEDAVRLLGDVGGFNVVVEEGSGGPVTVRLKQVDAFDALLALCEARGLEARTRRGIVVVAPPSRGGETAALGDRR